MILNKKKKLAFSFVAAARWPFGRQHQQHFSLSWMLRTLQSSWQRVQEGRKRNRSARRDELERAAWEAGWDCLQAPETGGKQKKFLKDAATNKTHKRDRNKNN